MRLQRLESHSTISTNRVIGMVKISGLEDLSRFILPDTKVFNTFKLVLGEEVIEVSGPVISRGWFGKCMISAARCLSRRV